MVSAQVVRTNAELLEQVCKIWVREDDLVADVTYGKGGWWKRYRPNYLVAHDLALDGVDFRNLPEADNTFDVVAFDPPYVSPGGRDTSTINDFNDRYGLHITPKTPRELFNLLINPGLTEINRVLKPGGIILGKVMDYVSSGRHQPCSLWLTTHAASVGLEVVDVFVHVSGTGPQPNRPRQYHSRKNHSLLYVFEKPKRPSR